MSTGAALALERLARRDGVTKREVLEPMIVARDQQVQAALDPDSPEWDVYFRGG